MNPNSASLSAGCEYDLIIIGAGPTGLSALFWACRAGLNAVALDAGAGPLSNIRDYPDQLVFVSPSYHFEIARIPLDCRDPTQLTREELLHYYARLVEYPGMRVRSGHRCIALVPDPEGVTVLAEQGIGRTIRLRARDVVFTSWYEPRPVPDQYVDASGTIPTVAVLRDPALCPPGPIAIVGGGMSARERAVSLMMAGRTVTVVARGRLVGSFRDSDFERLCRSTSSAMYECVDDLQVGPDGIRGRGPEGPIFVPCSAVVPCLGTRLAPRSIAILQEAGVFDAQTADSLARAESPDRLLRIREGGDFPAALEASLANWPDLGPHLFQGRARIRLAGAALHVGGPDAGVRVSIETARLAVNAILGFPAVSWEGRPLPRALLDWTENRPKPLPDFEYIAPLRPLVVRSWTRTALPTHREDDRGLLTTSRLAEAPDRYLLGPKLRDPLVRRLLRLSDGRANVSTIAVALSVTDQAGRDLLVRLLCLLMRRNALTWLPPIPGESRQPSERLGTQTVSDYS